MLIACILRSMKVIIKRLSIEIPSKLHKEMKVRALFRNITLRKWVMLAIMERIKKEKETE